MISLKIGQVLEKRENGSVWVVNIIAEGGAMLSGMWHTNEEIEKYFVLPMEKFVPKQGENYWVFGSLLKPFEIKYQGFLDQKNDIEIGNCFPNEAECQAMCDKIKELLANK